MRVSLIVALCLLSIQALGASPTPRAELQDAVSSLLCGDEKAMAKAELKIVFFARNGLTPEEQRWLLSEAVKVSKEERPDAEAPPSKRLLSAISRMPSAEIVPDVAAAYQALPEQRKGDALMLLVSIGTKASAQRAVQLLQADQGKWLTDQTFISVQRKPELSDSYFPALWSLSAPEALDSVLRLWLAWRDSRVVREIPPAAQERIIAAAEALRPAIQKAQSGKKLSFRFEEPYADKAIHLEILLDAMSSCAADRVRDLLQWASTLADPTLAAWAMTSQLAHGADLDPAAVQRVLRTPEVRSWFIPRLDAARKGSLVTDKWRSPEMVAEANLAQWLAYPAELGRPPDEMKLVKVVSDEAQRNDWYLFKFRVDPPYWAAKNGWMTGVSGPYAHGSSEMSRRDHDTFSELEKFDPKKVDEQFAAMRKTLDNWRKNRPPEE